MRHVVLKPFVDLGVYRAPGDTMEADADRAAKLRKLGLIGDPVADPTTAPTVEAAAVEPPENAAAPKPRKRKTKR